VAVGLNFMLALGLDYDQFGNTIVKQAPPKVEISQQPIVETPA
jgi:hypothetical protein